MFFNKKETSPRRRAATGSAPSLSPRFARLVRESWWLLVVAAFVWLALILAIAFVDEFVLELRGRRRAIQSDEMLHNE